MCDKKILATQHDPPVFLILPEGDVGGFASEQVSLEVDDVLGEMDELAAKYVVVDFCNVKFFGSCLLAAIQRIWKHLNRIGGLLAICNVSEVGLEVLHVSRFDELWKIYKTRDDARDGLMGQME